MGVGDSVDMTLGIVFLFLIVLVLVALFCLCPCLCLSLCVMCFVCVCLFGGGDFSKLDYVRHASHVQVGWGPGIGWTCLLG